MKSVLMKGVEMKRLINVNKIRGKSLRLSSNEKAIYVGIEAVYYFYIVCIVLYHSSRIK